MNTLINTTALLGSAIFISLAAASFASAQSAGDGGNGRGGDNGRGAGEAGTGVNDGGGGAEWLKKISVHDVRRVQPEIFEFRRRVRMPDGETCGHLYYQINRSNALSTVPKYRECLRRQGQ